MKDVATVSVFRSFILFPAFIFLFFFSFAVWEFYHGVLVQPIKSVFVEEKAFLLFLNGSVL